MDIKVGVDGCAATEIDPIFLDTGPTLLALNVDAVGVAGYNVVIDDLNDVLRSRLDHDSARFEMLEFTVFDSDVGVNADETGRARIIRRVSLQLATGHLDAGSLKYSDTWNLTIRLSEYSTKGKEDRKLNKI